MTVPDPDAPRPAASDLFDAGWAALGAAQAATPAPDPTLVAVANGVLGLLKLQMDRSGS